MKVDQVLVSELGNLMRTAMNKPSERQEKAGMEQINFDMHVCFAAIALCVAVLRNHYSSEELAYQTFRECVDWTERNAKATIEVIQ